MSGEPPAAAWLRIARSELAVADGPYDPDALPGVYCYLAQQSAEKAIKGVYVHRGIEPPRIHEIHVLLAGLDDVPEPVGRAVRLSEYIVETRYPGDMPDATVADRDAAVELARVVLAWAVVIIEGA